MLMGLESIYTYYSDAPPDAETLAIIAAGGSTVQYVDRAASQGIAYNQETGAAEPAAGSEYAASPFIQGGGNPLYANPANIPTPPSSTFTQACSPLDGPCVARYIQETNDLETLRIAYQQALNGNYDPTAPDRYVALLNQYYATHSLPASATSSPLPLGPPPPTGTTVPHVMPTSPPPVSQPLQRSTTATTQSTTPTYQQAIQPAVPTGGKGAAIESGTPAVAVPLPSWIWVAAAGLGALVLLGGRR